MQEAIPVMQFRGGSSKGLFFKAPDLPMDEKQRNSMVLAAMEGHGKGDVRQIDGLGGAHSLTSKVAIVSLSGSLDADLDYLFLQVVVGKGIVAAGQNCGNMLAAVVPFAVESGMMKASSPTTTAKVKMLNTGGLCEVTIQTPHGKVNYAGDAKVDGVPGTAAPVICNYLNTEGSTCGSLFPTGNLKDNINGMEVTCIDNGMPEILVKAEDVGISGYESPEDLNKAETLRMKLENIRLAMAPKMNLGDVMHLTIPKMCIVSQPQHGGAINTRTFIPHICHEAIGVLGAVSTATACVFKGTVANDIAASAQQGEDKLISVEHPAGEFTVSLRTETVDGKIKLKSSGVIRTARLLSSGLVYLPA